MIKTVEIKGEKVKVHQDSSFFKYIKHVSLCLWCLQSSFKHLLFQLQIWDTAGQERFRSITQSYYRSANALILTYDITCEDSFRCLPEWLREIEQYANNQVVTILVGKKVLLCTSRTDVLLLLSDSWISERKLYFLKWPGFPSPT